jgi:hypothetical protein
MITQPSARHWLAIRRLEAVPGLSSALTIGSVLSLTGIRINSIFVLVISLVIVSAAVRQFKPLGKRQRLDDVCGFVLVTSIMAFATGVFNIRIGFATLAILILGALIWRLRRSKTRHESEDGSGGEVDSSALSVLRQSMWLSITLTLLGWQSLGFFAAGLMAHQLLGRMKKCGVHSALLSLFPVTGFTLSYVLGPSFSGQYWVSVDQLWRSTVAAGVSRWGPSDFSGATGGLLRYHWLGEAAGGLISRITGISAVESMTKVIPVLATLAAFAVLRAIGSQLGFEPKVSNLGSAATMLLCREFDIFSPGSLWGITLFLIGVMFLACHVTGCLRGESSYTLSFLSAAIMVPLITLTQGTLGPVFFLVTLLTAGWAVLKRRHFLGEWLLVVTGQATSLLILRGTLLDSASSDMYAPTISLTSALQFRGIDVYNGDSIPIAMVVSCLFLLVAMQKGAGLILLTRSVVTQPSFISIVGATATSSLILANFVAMGGTESQQSRFLSPLVVVVTLCSSFALIQQLLQIKSRTDGRRIALLAIPCLFMLTSGLWISSQIYLSPWSLKRSVGIAFMIVLAQLLLLVIAWFKIGRKSSGEFQKQLTSLLLITIVIFASGRTLSHLVEFQRTAVDANRALEFTGGAPAQECFREIRLRTSRDAIIASNWFRTPTESRSPKNFMVSAWTERRVYLDGPEYIRYWVNAPRNNSDPDFDWVDYRYQATDDFAERATRESYAALRAANVEYFVIETLMPMPTTWEPLAEVVFEREPCKVLKLRT